MPAVRLPKRLAALGDPNYRRFFIGQAGSYLGDQMTPVAISFAVLDHRGGNATQVGWTMGAGTLTLVLFILLGGSMADRFPRRGVMMAADIARCCAQGAVAGLLLSGHWHVWEVAALEAVWGTGAAFFNPAMTGLVPELVEGEKLVQANALLNLSRALGQVAGPALAGVMVATAGPGWAVAVDAATFALSAFNLARMALPPAAQRAKANSVVADLLHGWAEFRSRTWLWAIVAEFSVFHLLVFGPEFVLGALVTKQHLGGAAAWGAINAGGGAGALVGGIVALHWRPRRPLVVATVGSMPFILLPGLLAALAPLPLIVSVSFLTGGGFALFGILWDTTMQQQVPGDVLSRVSSYDWFGSLALLPAGYVIAGPLAAVLGVAPTLYMGSAVMAVLILSILGVPSVRRLEALPLATSETEGRAAPA